MPHLPVPLAPTLIVRAALGSLLLAGLPARSLASVDLQYRVWTTEDGLPQGSAQAIAQTPDGYIWIATLDGLVRFDGVRMTVFSKSTVPEMRSNRCLSLLVDRRGTLWVGTEDGGVLQMAGGRFRPFDRSSGLTSGMVLRLTEDPDGRIVAWTSVDPAVFDGHRWLRFPDTPPPPAPVFPAGVPTVSADQRRQHTAIWIEGASGRLWVLESGVLHRRDGSIWQTFANPVPQLVLPKPMALFEDREGTLWIGGQHGLVQAIATPIRALVPSGSPDQRSIYTLAGDAEGRVWITTQSTSLRWDRGVLAPLVNLRWWPQDVMRVIEPDSDRGLIAGGPGGVYRIWPGRGFEKLADISPSDVLRDRRGTLWIASEGGLWRQSPSGFERVSGLASTDVKVLLESRDGAVWAGTYGGLARIDEAGVRTWSTADGLSSDRIRALHEDANGVLWIGTYDAGLNRFANGRFVAIRKRDGLYDDGAFAILDGADGRYYLCSNRGIYSVAIHELEAFAAATARRVTYRAWRNADGMPSSECNGGRQPSAFRAPDGTLWFPTARGIAVLDPRAVPANALAPPVVIEEIKTNRRNIPVGSSIRLAPSERSLEVRYTANTFIRPDGAQFRHRLDDFDSDWIDAENRRVVQYGAIPPGRYVLRIIAANSDGVWNTEGVSVSIQVDPSWWETRWFRGVVLSLVLAGLAFGYRYRVSSLERRQAAQDAFARQLIESQEAERKRIASELHDGIGQTIAVIRNRAALGLRDGRDVAMQQMEAIADAAGDAIDDVRKVAYGLRPYQLDRLGLKRALEALVEQTAAASGVAISATIADVNGLVASHDEMNIYRIVQESLANLVRYARATRGRVSVAVLEREITLRIDDNGVGFDPAVASGGLGLVGIVERARLLGGRATIRSAPGRGTTVLVTMPRLASSGFHSPDRHGG